MKTFKVLLLLSFISLSFTSYVSAQSSASSGQDYNNGIGLRLGGLTSGITYKHIGQSQGGFEGILSFGYRTFLITGLYEKHAAIANAPGLRWFYGGGGHFGFFRDGGYYYWVHHNGKVVYVESDYNGSRAVGGLDFILGLDYKFANAPFNLGLDLKPFIDFWDGPYLYFDGAFSIRYTF